MSIVTTMAEALTAAIKLRGVSLTAGEALVMARAALRAIKPEDVSDGMIEAFQDDLEAQGIVGWPGSSKVRRAIAAAIAAGAEQ